MVQDRRAVRGRHDLLLRRGENADHRFHNFRVDPVFDLIEEEEFVIGTEFRQDCNQAEHPVVHVPGFGGEPLVAVKLLDLQLLPAGLVERVDGLKLLVRLSSSRAICRRFSGPI